MPHRKEEASPPIDGAPTRGSSEATGCRPIVPRRLWPVLATGILVLVASLALPDGSLAQSQVGGADPSLGLAFRAGEGPAATVAVGLIATHPLGPRLQLRGEITKAYQGLESCEAEFPSSQRCNSSPFMGIAGLSLRRPLGSWALGLNAGGGLHREEEEFGGWAPLVQLGGVMERNIGPAWIAEATVSWARAFNDVWEDRLGEPLQYVLLGVGLRRRWSR